MNTGTTLGVEEEYQLLDAVTGRLTSRGAEVLAAAGDPRPGALVGELPLSQVEVATEVCHSLEGAEAALRRLRRTAADAAAAVGCRLGAVSTPPAGRWEENSPSDDPRYAPLRHLVGHLVDEQLISGMHVHVGIADRDLAVRAQDRMRPWLPVLLALSSGSPYWQDRDTGFASYRTVHWRRFPAVGPPPLLGGIAAYDALVGQLVATILPAETNVYWDVRPSVRWPTLEYRGADVALTVDDAVTLAGLVRALVRTGVTEARAERPVPQVPDALLSAAVWVAARHGLDERLVDPVGGGLRPAVEVVRDLLAHVDPELEATGDSARVRAGVDDLLRGGTSAARQRAAYGRGGQAAVVELVVRETVRGC